MILPAPIVALLQQSDNEITICVPITDLNLQKGKTSAAQNVSSALLRSTPFEPLQPRVPMMKAWISITQDLHTVSLNVLNSSMTGGGSIDWEVN